MDVVINIISRLTYLSDIRISGHTFIYVSVHTLSLKWKDGITNKHFLAHFIWQAAAYLLPISHLQMQQWDIKIQFRICHNIFEEYPSMYETQNKSPPKREHKKQKQKQNTKHNSRACWVTNQQGDTRINALLVGD